jgi:hypothetical protein
MDEIVFIFAKGLKSQRAKELGVNLYIQPSRKKNHNIKYPTWS